ncbi:hypothetical protein GCM10010435_13140 [Winogradskya consettensis]|uniref:Uncharacterized protein n=1 Tax=Winogradskya consettensis TaxID=113560 RepID=A0A919VJX8_9ACTN|nr:hypothetical protein [Actinoplanes consettensis]GIM68818.1 hypothetical protein Aco04nite_12410 [Actinoplanes consettensis]
MVFGPIRSWTLRGGDLTFEYGERAATELGFPTLHELQLDIPEDEIARTRDELLEILNGTCCVIDTPGLRYSD